MSDDIDDFLISADERLQELVRQFVREGKLDAESRDGKLVVDGDAFRELMETDSDAHAAVKRLMRASDVEKVDN